jgi:hypothetical protein
VGVKVIVAVSVGVKVYLGVSVAVGGAGVSVDGIRVGVALGAGSTIPLHPEKNNNPINHTAKYRLRMRASINTSDYNPACALSKRLIYSL